MPAAKTIDSRSPADAHARATRLFAACLCALFAVSASAAPLGYTATGDQGEQLAEIDLATGSIRTIGSFGAIGATPFGDVEGMALDSKGRLFAVADVSENLLRIDVSNGAASSIGPLFGLGLRGQGAGPLNQLDIGLAFTCDGRLWMSSDAVKKLWEVDLTTGVAMEVGTIGKKISGLAGRDNELYGIGVDEDEGLYRIDRDTAAATLIGRTGLGYAFYDAGLDFDADGNLWATLDFNPPPSGRTEDYRASEIIRIDRLTGQASDVRVVQGPVTIEVEALALAPAACIDGTPPPEIEPVIVDALQPRPLGLLTIGIALLGLIGLRRRG